MQSARFNLSILTFVLNASCGGGTPLHEQQTEQDFDRIEQLLFARFLEDRQLDLATDLSGNKQLVKEEKGFLIDENMTISQGLIIDHFGVPYRIMNRGSGIIEIRSFGPNTRNDQGAGDDLSRLVSFKK